MRTKRNNFGSMVLKIDLEKAYDRLNWDFLQKNSDIGLSFSFVNIIMHCVTTCEMQVLWNGEHTRAFKPTRGVRQGDPLSPYLFVLCMERLAHCIEDAINLKTWKPFYLVRNGPLISHLFFLPTIFFCSRKLQ